MAVKYIKIAMEKFAAIGQELGILKIAQASLEISSFLKDLKKKDGSIYVVVAAVGAGEFFGSNSRGDFFPEDELLRHHKTFENGHVFVQHDNKDPKKAIGKILFSSYNLKLHRVELVLEIWRDKTPETLLKKIDAGEPMDVSMGCFLPGTEVVKADGRTVEIEKTEIGDTVLNDCAKKVVVTEVHKREYNGTIYKVKPFSYPYIDSTEEHPWRAIHRDKCGKRSIDRVFRWKKDEEIDVEKEKEWICSKHLSDKTEDYFLMQPIPRYIETPDWVTRDFARLCGYYLSEGFVVRNKNKEIGGLVLTTDKNGHIDKDIDEVCESLTDKKCVRYYSERSDKVVYIQLYDAKLAEQIYLLMGCYAKEKYLDEKVMYWHPEFQLDLLGAYIDGDGCQAKGKWQPGSVTISTASSQLARQIYLMGLRCGIIMSINRITHLPSRIVKIKTIEWQLYIGKTNGIEKLVAVSGKVSMPHIVHNQNNRKIVGDYLLIPIRSIESYEYKGFVHNIEVDEGESYLVEGIAVHNCKVKSESCSICGHVSTSIKERCDHLARHIGDTLPDGRKVYAINYEPNFFDLSYVRKGADGTGKMLQKIASFDKQVLQGILDSWGKRSTFSKEAKISKKSDIVKRVPGQFATAIHRKADRLGDRYLKHLDVVRNQFKKKAERLTPALSDKEIQKIAEYPLDVALSTLRCCHVNLSPPEFQKLVLTKIGMEKTARDFEAQRITFDYREEDEIPWDERHIQLSDIKVAEDLDDIIVKRSSFAPALLDRVASYSDPIRSGNDFMLYKTAANPILDKIKLAYRHFRALPPEQRAPMNFYILLSALLGYGVLKSGVLSPGIEGRSHTGEYMTPARYRQLLRKQAELIEKDAAISKPLMIASVPLGWFGHAEWQKMRAARGQGTAAPLQWAARHPLAATVGTYGLMALARAKRIPFLKKATVAEFSSDKTSSLGEMFGSFESLFNLPVWFTE